MLVARKGQELKAQNRTAIGFFSALFTAESPVPRVAPDTQLTLRKTPSNEGTDEEIIFESTVAHSRFNPWVVRQNSRGSRDRVGVGKTLEGDGFLPCGFGPVLHHCGPQLPHL